MLGLSRKTEGMAHPRLRFGTRTGPPTMLSTTDRTFGCAEVAARKSGSWPTWCHRHSDVAESSPSADWERSPLRSWFVSQRSAGSSHVSGSLRSRKGATRSTLSQAASTQGCSSSFGIRPRLTIQPWVFHCSISSAVSSTPNAPGSESSTPCTSGSNGRPFPRSTRGSTLTFSSTVAAVPSRCVASTRVRRRAPICLQAYGVGIYALYQPVLRTS